MAASTWLERVLQSLRENGMPERQQLRFLEELQDHITDLQEAGMSETEVHDLDRNMGPPEPIAEALADAYRRKRLLVRQPWLAYLAFTLGPVAMQWALILCMSCLALAVAIAFTSDLDILVPMVFGISFMLSGIGVSAWFCVAARRNRLSWVQSLLACAAVAASTMFLGFVIDEDFESLPPVLLPTAALTGAAAVFTWYLAAWRNRKWLEKPISLSARFPILSSGLGSLLVAVSCIAVHLIIVGVVVGMLPREGDLQRYADWFVLLNYSCRYVPYALAVYLSWRMTQRCKRPILCSLTASLCVAMLAALFQAGFGTSPEGLSEFQLGIGVVMALGWRALGQFLTPLGIWAVLMLYARRSMRLRVG